MPLRTYAPRTWPRRDYAQAVLARLARAHWTCFTKLRAFYLECPGAAWSVAELAEALGYAERTVWEALKEMRLCADFELVEHEVEVPVWLPYGAVPMRRWVLYPEEDQGGLQARSPSSSLDSDSNSDPAVPGATRHVDLERNSDLSIEGPISEPHLLPKSNPHARTRTPRTAARAPSAKFRRRDDRRPPAHRHPAPERLTAPVAVEAEVWAALSRLYDGRTATLLRAELCLPKYHQHPDDARRALRTCLERTPLHPGRLGVRRMFRGFFKLAVRGEPLCDRDEWVRAHLGAEAEALQHDLPPDVDLHALLERLRRAGKPIPTEPGELVRLACDELRQRTDEEIWGGTPPWLAPAPTAAQVRFARLLELLAALSADDPQRPALEAEAMRLYACGVRPPGQPARVAPAAGSER